MGPDGVLNRNCTLRPRDVLDNPETYPAIWESIRAADANAKIGLSEDLCSLGDADLYNLLKAIADGYGHVWCGVVTREAFAAAFTFCTARRRIAA